MKIKRLVLGTGNSGKLQEWNKLLEKIIFLVGISEFGHLPKPKENGRTFEENARQKATHYAKLTREYVFSEDGGYEIEALGGAPGPRSRRILPGGKEGTDEDLINYILRELEGLPKEKRGVKLTVAAAVSSPKGKIIFEDRASISGIVTRKPGPVKIEGYPFRSIHFLPKLGKTYAELTEEEHEKYNHKRQIAERLARFLLEYK